MDPSSSEATQPQLDLALAQGDACGRALAYMTGEVAKDGGEQQAGHYLIGYAIEDAEGMDTRSPIVLEDEQQWWWAGRPAVRVGLRLRGVMMWDRLRQPGGTLGGLSIASAVVLALVGALGVIALLVGLVVGSDFWSDRTSDVVISIVLFGLTAAGAVGFYVMDRQPWAGAAAVVVGGIALAVIVFWTIVTMLIGVGIAAVAVVRARALAHPTPTAHHPI